MLTSHLWSIIINQFVTNCPVTRKNQAFIQRFLYELCHGEPGKWGGAACLQRGIPTSKWKRNDRIRVPPLTGLGAEWASVTANITERETRGVLCLWTKEHAFYVLTKGIGPDSARVSRPGYRFAGDTSDRKTVQEAHTCAIRKSRLWKRSGSNSPGSSADEGTDKRKGWRGEITVLRNH